MPRGISRLGLIASAPRAVEDSKPTRMRMAMVDWNNSPEKMCGVMMDVAVVWNQASGATWSGFWTRKRIARMLKMTSAVSWIMLITILAVVEPLIPRTAIMPTIAEKMQAIPI